MPWYTFERNDSPEGVLASKDLGTDVLNALQEIVSDGHPLQFDHTQMKQIFRDGDTEKVILQVEGPPSIHWPGEVGNYFSRRGVRFYAASERE